MSNKCNNTSIVGGVVNINECPHHHQHHHEGFNVIRTGYMKKIKTGRRKWFVLRKETPEAQARLEYYDSEKKYQSGVPPRKIILLKTCFNINQINDTKHKNVIALYTKDECLQLSIDDEGEAEDWFKDLLLMQQGEDLPEGQIPRPTFAHVWDVVLVNRGLGTQELIGNYRLCLKEKTLSLVRRDYDYSQIDLNLSSIRSTGSLQKYVFLEVGRNSPLGSGELWLLTEDQNIAQNVHSTVYHAMSKSSNKDEMGPKCRNRSASATETSKPMSNKKLYSKGHLFSQDHSQNNESCATPTQSIQNSLGITSSGGRERCDSMPSRARTASEGNHPIPMYQCGGRSHLAPHRPSSIFRDIGNGSPIGSPISPPSAAASTDSAGSSYSLVDENEDLDSNHGRYSHSLTPDEAIAEEECDGHCISYGISPNTGDYLPMAPASSDDGYVDMSPKGRHNNITPAASLSSVTSGTPSTDMKFVEYQLDKVMAYFPPSSDEEARPIRAYSVGSRPDMYKHKKHLIDIHGIESRRDRAASVGSKTKKGPVRVLPPHGHYQQTHPKSSSAPILSTSRLPNVGSGMHDLMELDFSSNKKRSMEGYLEMKSPKSSTSTTPATTPSGYVEMKPGVTPTNNSGPYLEMRPGSSPNRTNDYSNISHNNRSVDYMDMNAKNSTKKPITNNNNYSYSNYVEYDMNQPHQTSIRRSYSQLSPSSCNYYKNIGSPNNTEYMDMHCNNRNRNDSDRSNEGYVEMTLGSKNHQRQSSLDSAQIKNEDYALMGTTSSSTKQNNEIKDTNRSLPIQILNTNQNINNTTTTMYGRGYKDTNKMQLQLTNTTTSPNSSLPRCRKNSNTRRDSRDSSSSSVTTTPSNSSTIFPLSLNSPSSPLKPKTTIVSTPEKSTQSLFNNLYKKFRGKSSSNNENQNKDYTVMDFQQKNNKTTSDDYINLDIIKKSIDYAVIEPKKNLIKNNDKTLNVLTESRGFKPIIELQQNDNCLINKLDEISENLKNDTSSNSSCSKRSDSLNGEIGGGVICINKNTTTTTSRPGSASSDLCSSTSTLVGSRPDSVNSDSIRPSSTSSLHYASLDLQKNDEDINTTTNNKTIRTNSNESNNDLTYAEIDFNKSEEFKKVKNVM